MKPALILAGGLGTRLRHVVGEVPKPLAPVADQPFLWWLLRQLEGQGVTDVYLSVGYRHEMIQSNLGDQYGGMRLRYVIEHEPLGTGGAILEALKVIPEQDLLILNGDTLALVDLRAFIADAEARRADVSVAVANVSDAGRYGTVEIAPDSHRIEAFIEKGRSGSGCINAGVYHVRKEALLSVDLPRKFSFEQDYLANQVGHINLIAFPHVTDFIDIGVPEDYSLAQTKVPSLVSDQ